MPDAELPRATALLLAFPGEPPGGVVLHDRSVDGRKHDHAHEGRPIRERRRGQGNDSPDECRQSEQ